MSPLFLVSYLAVWVLLVTMLFSIFLLYRYLGQGLLNSRQGRARQGPRRGDLIPPLTAHDLRGEAKALGGPSALPRLLFFVSASCGPCRSARRALREFALEHRANLHITVICGGLEGEVRQFAAPLPHVISVIADQNWSIGHRLRIDATPFAVLLNEAGVTLAKGMPTKIEQFRWFSDQLRREKPFETPVEDIPPLKEEVGT